ncbi:very short patch repair endonuclease, partial [Escherichia coli]|nr:very short patch repair endonuclease [Escherichia coli]
MADTLSKERRSELMKRVKREGTAPELLVRSGLHKRGLRYNIGDRRLPGSPDLSFPRWRVAIFIHGCFWHGHRCRLGREPSS